MIKSLYEDDLTKSIKDMDVNELELTAISIRDFLIDNISKTGGHLASNLGVVEITLGLHKVFDFDRDKIIWDVGHQAYVHKILTGRAKLFPTLRKDGGMSGFPKRHESSYDFYDTGHSSTSISAAAGFAAARDLNGDNYDVISVIGDGSMTGGPALEALNNVGISRSKVIIVLNDNGMSISSNTGGISEHLDKLRTSTKYQNSKIYLKKALNMIPAVGKTLENTFADIKERIKYMLLSGGVMFEEFGLTYLGPVDGHDMEDVIKVFEQAKNVKGPVLIHFITKKGKGYRPAELDPNSFHGVGAFDKETGKALSKKSTSYSDVFGSVMLELAEKNKDIIAVTAAMCDATGLSPMLEKYPKRVFDVGIAEAHGVIFAAGAAANGLKPVVAIYSSFLQRAYDEIIEDVCLMRLPVIFALDRAGIVGADGETHHGVFDISYLLPLPNMTVLAPCDAVQLKEAMIYASKLNAPCALRYPRGDAETELLTGEAFAGKNIRVREGKDFDIYAVGTMLSNALKASDMLKADGISAGVVNIGIIKPFDASVMQTADVPILTAEDNIITGGFGQFLSSCCPEHKITIAAWPDQFIEHGSCTSLYSKYLLDAEGLYERIKKELESQA